MRTNARGALRPIAYSPHPTEDLHRAPVEPLLLWCLGFDARAPLRCVTASNEAVRLEFDGEKGGGLVGAGAGHDPGRWSDFPLLFSTIRPLLL
jgi:hypothetical protein